ncbi:dTDP-4-dehydrorhamnose 3,5-epimerase [Aidingimonas lacisalsi]|uniref:dTDP-4-dehydrorhamnose 3,5-epimerase n=1 Tax=Aidingimonas lacisalsi TaxID=2604086 RepID=UPI0011D241DF|nr:dTDP-4-dehydrorhamnose 3,5-epimerase [Aidingimonas lacisalsi]
MYITPSSIPDVKLIEPRVFEDDRGFFMESWNARVFAEAGIDHPFVQDNHSRSVKHTLRGLHYQIRQPQGKLVRVTQGEVFDVAVDLRLSSTTFRKWVGFYLSAENKRMLWIPPGFAHGFYVTTEVAEFQYKCTAYYSPEHERILRWDDPAVAVQWPRPAPEEVVLSEKDRRGVSLVTADVYP